METTVSNSALRLTLQLVLLIAAVHGQPWCGPDLPLYSDATVRAEISFTCDNSNNPTVVWMTFGTTICWGYTCDDGKHEGLLEECASGGALSNSGKRELPSPPGMQCSFYPCIEIIDEGYEPYKLNYTVSCPDNPQPTTTIASSTAASLQHSNTTAVSLQYSSTTAVTLQYSSTKAASLQYSSTTAISLQHSNTTTVATPSHTPGEVTSQLMHPSNAPITPTTPVPSTIPSETPTVQTTVIILSASILGVLVIVLLIVLLCSTMLKRYRSWQHKIVFDGGMPEWEPFDTFVTLSISISTLTEPLEKYDYETKTQIGSLVSKNDDDCDIASSVSSASEILGEPLKDFTRHHSNSDYVKVNSAQSLPLAWDHSGSDQCSTIAATSSGYLEYQGSIGTCHRQLEYSSSVETSDGNMDYQGSNGLVETGDGYLRQQDNEEPSTGQEHYNLVATSSGYVQYKDSNETSDKGSYEHTTGYLQYQDIHETSYQPTEEFVETSSGYVQYKDCNKESSYEHMKYQERAESTSDYIDSKDTSCGHMPYQGHVDTSGGYIDSKDTSCGHMPYQALADNSGGYLDSKDTSCGHMHSSSGYIDSSCEQQRELVESSDDGYIHYNDCKVDTSCRQIQYQELMESNSGYIHYQDNNGYLHTNPV